MPTRFPHVELWVPQPNLSFWETAVVSGDYSNIPSLVSTITRGFSINWKEASEFWKKENISSVGDFSRLVFIWPPSVLSVSPSNLRLLIKMSNEIIIPLAVVQHYNPNSDLFMFALWKIYRLERYLSGKSTVLERNGHYLLIHSKFKTTSVPLLDLLLWASSNAFDTLQVRPDVETFTSFIQEDLFSISNNIVKESGPEKPELHKLWSGTFAPLLKQGNGHTGLSYLPLIYIGSSQHPPHRFWPKCVKLFSYLWHGTLDSNGSEELLNYSEFLDIPSLPNHLLCNLIMVRPKPLSIAWQELLLSKPLAIDISSPGWENVFIPVLKKRRDFVINLKSCTLKGNLLALQKRLYPPPTKPQFFVPESERDGNLMQHLTEKQKVEEREKRKKQKENITLKWNPNKKSKHIYLSNSNTTAQTKGSSCNDKNVILASEEDIFTCGLNYFEMIYDVSGGAYDAIGVVNEKFDVLKGRGSLNHSAWFYVPGGGIYHDNQCQRYGTSWSRGDIIGILVDVFEKTIEFFVNGKSQGIAYNNLVGENFYLAGCLCHDGIQMSIRYAEIPNY